MPEIVFACISPHPPIILPSVGSDKDRQKVKKTIENLNLLEKKLRESSPDLIIISSPHADWGFNVPLSFLAKNFKGEIKRYLTSEGSPQSYFDEGKRYRLEGKKKIAIIASGDLSHCLKADGPYGLNSQGSLFDQSLIKCLEKKDIKGILKLDKKYPEAGECGLRSFCFTLGVLEGLKSSYKPEILSYEGPFGVGYLVAEFKLND